jgi:hypothetical protein
MLLGMSYSQWGAILFTGGLIMYLLRIRARERAIMAGVGVCLLSGGMVTKILVGLATWVAHLTSALIGRLFGVGVPGALALIIGAVLLHDLHPRGGGASKRTFWLAIAFAACLIAGVGAFAQMNAIPADLRGGLSNLGG